MSDRKRLIVCLDGTWNQQDSSTNVLHHYNLVIEGIDHGTDMLQKKHYVQGVGTHTFDSVTGGGLGLGLEENIRQGYDWLVEQYCENDEIYIFGFSRGAYTARSLVGFISQCGLLRRGAPIPVSELWRAYCLLGRQKEHRKSFWDKLFQQDQLPIRMLTEIANDPWVHNGHEVKTPTITEKLLIHWSRRVRITYLGIYDTVGAIGWDALAIPGLRSKLALHNNTNPTSILQKCRHALAIDEHRSNFNHTPFRNYISHRDGSEEDLNKWDRKIEQRWFAGAHSNIGGSYEDNRMAERPFQWVLEGAAEQGLRMERPDFDPPPAAQEKTSSVEDWNQKPRDSFAAFGPFWTMVLRAKRNYRSIDPDPAPFASATPGGAGYSLASIHEQLDETALDFWGQSGQPMPPNLNEYFVRRKKEIRGLPPAHSWLEGKLSEYAGLVVWASFAAAGLASLCVLIDLEVAGTWYRYGAWFAAFFFPWVDWSESCANFNRASGKSDSPAFRAFLDSVYWTRAFGFVLVVFGILNAIYFLGLMGWHWDGVGAIGLAEFYWGVPVLAAAGVLTASRLRPGNSWMGSMIGVAATFLIGGLLFLLFWIPGRLFQAESASVEFQPLADHLSLAGLLLVLQLALVYVWRAALWSGEPMDKANLGSVVELQRCFTAGRVKVCLENWRTMLACNWSNEDKDRVKGPVDGPAGRRMREVAGEALWRDLVGFIPVYTGFLLFGLWLSVYYVNPSPFNFRSCPYSDVLWWLIPVVTAIADYIEDACHLSYLRLHAEGKPVPPKLPPFACTMTFIKLAGFFPALVLTLVALVSATLQVAQDLSEWRAKTAVAISAVLALILIVYLIGRLRYAPPPDSGSDTD